MQIDKEQIVDLIKNRAGQAKAEQAQGELPDKVDPDEHVDLLGKFGVNPSELAGGLGGKIGF